MDENKKKGARSSTATKRSAPRKRTTTSRSTTREKAGSGTAATTAKRGSTGRSSQKTPQDESSTTTKETAPGEEAEAPRTPRRSAAAKAARSRPTQAQSDGSRAENAQTAEPEAGEARAGEARTGGALKPREAERTSTAGDAGAVADEPAPPTRTQDDAPQPTSVSDLLEEQSRSILEVQGLVKVYGGRAVVDNVSFTVRRGEIIGLLGKNGAGKTTTFRMTIGMIGADEGSIRFNGREVARMPMYKRARLGMGYLSQESSVFRGLTVEQNLNAILETTTLRHSERVRLRDELVAEFGLEKLRGSKAAVLSGGEKRRLEIARALITSPKLILLDEPFSGVDPIAVSDIQQIIFRLREERGISILLTDHNVRETLNTTDRSFIILDGRIIAQGNRDEILSDKNARRHYLGEKFSM